MSDDSPLAPFAYEGLDPVPEPKSTIAEVSDAVKGTINRVSGAIVAGRKPGMPLSILSHVAREAPLERSCSELPSPAAGDCFESALTVKICRPSVNA